MQCLAPLNQPSKHARGSGYPSAQPVSCACRAPRTSSSTTRSVFLSRRSNSITRHYHSPPSSVTRPEPVDRYPVSAEGPSTTESATYTSDQLELDIEFERCTSVQDNILEQVNAKINSLAEVGDADGALAEFNRLRGARMCPNVETYTAVFRAYKKAATVESSAVSQLWQYMEMQGAWPAPPTFHEILAAYSRAADWQRALDCMGVMQERGIPLDTRMYTSVVSAFGKAGKLHDARQMFSRMAKSGSPMDVEGYNALLYAYFHAKRWKPALRTFNDMQKVVKPSLVTYNLVIKIAARKGDWHLAMNIFEAIGAAGLEANEVTYCDTVTACSRAGQWQVAAGVLNSMRHALPAPHPAAPYNAMISCYASSRQVAKCMPMLRRMQDQGLAQPDQVTFNAVFTALLGTDSEARFDDVVEALDRLIAARLPAPFTTFNLFASACAASGAPWPDVADTLLHRLDQAERREDSEGGAGGEPGGGRGAGGAGGAGSAVAESSVVVNALMCVFERAGLQDDAFTLYRHTLRRGMAPSLVAYNALLGTCEAQADWAQALVVHREMTERRVKPDARTYNALISTSEEAGKWDRATEWLQLAQDRGFFKMGWTDGELDLHCVPSAGTAQAMLRLWLRRLRETLLVNPAHIDDLPNQFKVVTGWGKHSSVQGVSPVKQRVVYLLQTLSSPFELPVGNAGCLVAASDDVRAWLVKGELMSLLRFLGGDEEAWRRNFRPQDAVTEPQAGASPKTAAKRRMEVSSLGKEQASSATVESSFYL